MADIDPAVAQALERVIAGRREQGKLLKRYDHAYEVYNASGPAGSADPWQSKLRIKYGKQVIDTALVNIVSGMPRIVVRPRHPESERGAKAMQIILDYYAGEDHLVEAQPVFTQQALICGVTAAKVHWLYKEANRPVKVFSHNAMDPAVPLVSAEMQRLIVRDGPTFEPWNVYHTFWEPGARDADSAAYVVLQTYLSKDDLEQLAFNPDTGKGVYHNVKELLAAGAAPQPRQSSQTRIRQLDEAYKDKFLVEEIWTDDELMVVGNGQVLLRHQPNPYWHGKKPVVIAQTNPDLFEMVGASETELVDHIQQALHTVQNMRFDNMHLSVMRGVTYREGGVTDPNMLELKPRFKWPVADHDDVRPFEVQPLPPEAYQEEQSLLSHMQLVTGINSYISGADMQGVDQNTATGVTALQEVASRLLRFKAAQLQYKGYQRTFEMWGDMAQQMHDKDLPVKVTGQGNDAEWVDVGPQDIVGHFDYKIEGSEESLSRQQERGEAIALLNAFAPLLANRPDINIKPIMERVASAYNFPNPEVLFQQPQAPPQASPSPDQGFNPQILGPRIGSVPQRNAQMQQGGLQLDPRLSTALQRNTSGQG